MSSLILLHGPLQLRHHCLNIQLRPVLDFVSTYKKVRSKHSVRDLAAQGIPAIQEANIVVLSPRHLQPSAVSKATGISKCVQLNA